MLAKSFKYMHNNTSEKLNGITIKKQGNNSMNEIQSKLEILAINSLYSGELNISVLPKS